MKRLNLGVLASVVLGLTASPLAVNAANSKPAPRVVTRTSPAADAAAPRLDPKATAAAYSAQVNIVTRVQGTSFFRTAIDITNNTSTNGVVARIQYCYTFNGAYQGCTASQDIGLQALDNFHQDDMVAYLGTLGVLAPGAENSSFGTLLVTFDNLPSNFGWEGTATARTYSPYDQSNPALGTVAIAYPGSLFFESANTTLVATIRDTTPAPTEAGSLRTNLGLTNTDLNGAGPVNITLTFFDPATGQAVGNAQTVNGLAPGEVRQINNVFNVAAIPTSIQSLIVFADVTSPTTGFPTIEGYVDILDGGTQDGAYFEMKCGDTDGCGN
jgi:hypothetical protein